MDRKSILIDLPAAVARALHAEARRRDDTSGRVVEEALRPFLAGLRAVRVEVEHAGRHAASSEPGTGSNQ